MSSASEEAGLSPQERATLEEYQRVIGVPFRNIGLLRRALVHRSYLNENPDFPVGSNERLEFLGDAVLGFIIAEHLYEKYPDLTEGELTALRAALVKSSTLARFAKRLDLGDYIYLGRGEAESGGRARQPILASGLEALIGAIYLDRGIEEARHFILQFSADEILAIEQGELPKDFKSRLQELAQAELRLTPVYETVAATGPDHAKEFVVEVRVGGNALAQGTGRSKQIAEQEAARQALENWSKTSPQT